MNAITTSVNRWSVADGLWLCLAVVLHALLLLVPVLQNKQTPGGKPPLIITFLSPAPIENPFVGEAESKKSELQPLKNRTVTPDEYPAPKLANLEEPETLAEHNPPATIVLLTTARLLDSASEMTWPVPALNNSRQLGVFVPQALPENWRSGSAFTDNILNPMVLPNKTEIVDSWLALDGTYNIIINAPNGYMLCGQKAAWDPMQPLVEHLIQFRRCGGNKKRTLEMVQRIKRVTSSLH